MSAAMLRLHKTLPASMIVFERVITDAVLNVKCVGNIRSARHRLGIIEPVFANLRYNKRLARFTLRGRAKVDGQWKLFALVHNIEKLARSRSAA